MSQCNSEREQALADRAEEPTHICPPTRPTPPPQHFMSQCNSELEQALADRAEELAGMGTTQRVREGVKLRLEMNKPYIGG